MFVVKTTTPSAAASFVHSPCLDEGHASVDHVAAKKSPSTSFSVGTFFAFHLDPRIHNVRLMRRQNQSGVSDEKRSTLCTVSGIAHLCRSVSIVL